jgi:hypothetical protein
MSSAEKIAKTVFKKEPAPPCSISFSIEEDMELKEIFEMLLMIFTEGMKILFADSDDKVDLNSLREQDFIKVQEYFKSFGFVCNYKVYLPSQANVMDFQSRKYTNITITPKTKLADLRLPLKCGPRIFEINFDYFISIPK